MEAIEHYGAVSLFYALSLRVAWRILPVVMNVPKRYLQLSFEDKKSYITNLSLMGETDPWDLLKGGSFRDSV